MKITKKNASIPGAFEEINEAVLLVYSRNIHIFTPSRGRCHRANEKMQVQETLSLATFGAGCFWCVEAVFEEVAGVSSVLSGYAGGAGEAANYEQVSSGKTRHAEVVQVSYDPRKVSYADLLAIFWRTHDPTTPNQQGYDVGSQYRSVIFYHDEVQCRVPPGRTGGNWSKPPSMKHPS